MKARLDRDARRENARPQMARGGVTDDEVWDAWLARHPYDAELWAEEGDRFRQAIEGTLGYQLHVLGLRSGAGIEALRAPFDDLRDRMLVRALRATGEDELADRIEGDA